MRPSPTPPSSGRAAEKRGPSGCCRARRYLRPPSPSGTTATSSCSPIPSARPPTPLGTTATSSCSPSPSARPPTPSGTTATSSKSVASSDPVRTQAGKALVVFKQREGDEKPYCRCGQNADQTDCLDTTKEMEFKCQVTAAFGDFGGESACENSGRGAASSSMTGPRAASNLLARRDECERKGGQCSSFLFEACRLVQPATPSATMVRHGTPPGPEAGWWHAFR